MYHHMFDDPAMSASKARFITEELEPEFQENALKHGLTSAKPLTKDEVKLYNETVESWIDQSGAGDGIEGALMQRAAVAMLQLRRAERAEVKALQKNVRKAVSRWTKKRRHAVRRKAQDLRDDPAGIIEELEASSFGCDWMIGHWKNLRSELEAGRAWSLEDFQQAVRLLGRDVRPPNPEDAPISRLWELARAGGIPTGEHSETTDKTDVKSIEQTDINDLRSFDDLIVLVNEQIQRLEYLRAFAWETHDREERAGVAAEAEIDISKEGQLRMRYAREADLSLQRNIGQFVKLRGLRVRELEAQTQAAKHNVISMRKSVGGGWWREEGADPAPPGFIRAADAPPERPWTNHPDAPAWTPPPPPTPDRGDNPSSNNNINITRDPNMSTDPIPGASGHRNDPSERTGSDELKSSSENDFGARSEADSESPRGRTEPPPGPSGGAPRPFPDDR